MYLAILDDHHNELTMNRVCLFDTLFKLSPSCNEDCDYTLVNTTWIQTSNLQAAKGWAAGLGVCKEADSPPFMVVPLDHGRLLFAGEALAIRPGKLVITVTGLKPSGRQVLEPLPPTLYEQLKSRVL